MAPRSSALALDATPEGVASRLPSPEAAAFAASLGAARPGAQPFTHWSLADLLPWRTWRDLCALPFAAPDLGGVSGTREVHNQTRVYFDAANIVRHAACARVAQAFQAPQTVGLIEQVTGARLEGCSLRIEYAQDTGDFWLTPHTDLGVKTFTLLIYLADTPGQDSLGTDLYRGPGAWAGRIPFTPNTALAFIPSHDTWHGFEPRRIEGIRHSVILNYVTQDWRAREQLAYPDQPVRA